MQRRFCISRHYVNPPTPPRSTSSVRCHNCCGFSCRRKWVSMWSKLIRSGRPPSRDSDGPQVSGPRTGVLLGQGGEGTPLWSETGGVPLGGYNTFSQYGPLHPPQAPYDETGVSYFDYGSGYVIFLIRGRGCGSPRHGTHGVEGTDTVAPPRLPDKRTPPSGRG